MMVREIAADPSGLEQFASTNKEIDEESQIEPTFEAARASEMTE